MVTPFSQNQTFIVLSERLENAGCLQIQYLSNIPYASMSSQKEPKSIDMQVGTMQIVDCVRFLKRFSYLYLEWNISHLWSHIIRSCLIWEIYGFLSSLYWNMRSRLFFEPALDTFEYSWWVGRCHTEPRDQLLAPAKAPAIKLINCQVESSTIIMFSTRITM